jgi:hypothetical protein
MQHVLLFVQAIIAASDDPNMSKQATAHKRKCNFNVFSETRLESGESCGEFFNYL